MLMHDNLLFLLPPLKRHYVRTQSDNGLEHVNQGFLRISEVHVNVSDHLLQISDYWIFPVM